MPIKRWRTKPGSPAPEGGEAAPIGVTVDVKEGGATFHFRESDVKLSSEWLILVSHYLRARLAFRSDLEMARNLGLDRTRLIAWKKGLSAPRQEHVRFLADVATTVDALRRFLHPSVITGWLTAPKLELGGRTPVEMLREGRLPEVLQSANATEHGAYV